MSWALIYEYADQAYLCSSCEDSKSYNHPQGSKCFYFLRFCSILVQISTVVRSRPKLSLPFAFRGLGYHHAWSMSYIRVREFSTKNGLETKISKRNWSALEFWETLGRLSTSRLSQTRSHASKTRYSIALRNLFLVATVFHKQLFERSCVCAETGRLAKCGNTCVRVARTFYLDTKQRTLFFSLLLYCVKSTSISSG